MSDTDEFPAGVRLPEVLPCSSIREVYGYDHGFEGIVTVDWDDEDDRPTLGAPREIYLGFRREIIGPDEFGVLYEWRGGKYVMARRFFSRSVAVDSTAA